MERRRRLCHGVGFHEEEYIVLIEPEPWPCTIACCCLCQCLGMCIGFLCDILVKLVVYAEYIFCGIFTLSLCCSLIILPILLPVLNSIGSEPPRTELEGVTIHAFNLTRDYAYTPTPWIRQWLLSANLTVSFQARNPSWVVGFRHQYLNTTVSGGEVYEIWGESKPVPVFSVGHRSVRTMSANIVVSEQRIEAGDGLEYYMQNQGVVHFVIRVDSYVMVKRLQWQDPKWFQLSCLVDVSMMNATEKEGKLLNKICPW